MRAHPSGAVEIADTSGPLGAVAVMGEIVGAFGVPHTPRFPAQAKEDSEIGRELRELYGEVAGRLERSKPDVVLLFSSDHFHSYFRDIPSFAIGTSDVAYGPCDNTNMPAYRLVVETELACELLAAGLDLGVDWCRANEFELDHSFLVPYHFLVRDRRTPIIPIFVNGLAAPLPSASRCIAVGQAIRKVVDAFADGRRVAVVASGSFSLDLGGVHDGVAGGNGAVPDPDWVARVIELLERGSLPTLEREASKEQLDRAGNIGGEILNWLVMLGAAGQLELDYLKWQQPFGHAFAAWFPSRAQ